MNVFCFYFFCIYFGFNSIPSVALSVCGFRGDKVDVGRRQQRFDGGKTQSNYYLCINRLIYSLIIYELFLVGPSSSELYRTTIWALSGGSRLRLPRSRFQLVLAQRSPLTSRQLVSFDLDFVSVSVSSSFVVVVLFCFMYSIYMYMDLYIYIYLFTFMYALVSLCFYADENIYVLLIAHKLIYILWRWRYVRSTNGPRRHCLCLCLVASRRICKSQFGHRHRLRLRYKSI